MTEEEFLRIKGQSDKTEDKYMHNTGKKIILTFTDYIEKYPFKTTRLERMINLLDIGITDRYFGGNAKKAAIVSGKPYIILADKNDNTVAIYVPEPDKLTFAELKAICDRYKISVSKEDKKDDLIKKLTK